MIDIEKVGLKESDISNLSHFTIADFINCAIEQYDECGEIEKLEAMITLADVFKKYNRR